MANGPSLSTVTRSLSLLDVLHANQFEGKSFDPETLEETEENLYRGAPPEWLNFHISEQAELDGTGSPFIKRDGYVKLMKQIHKLRKHPGISTVKLFHQPGCGGTTLAMKVLWDFKKTLRSAVLTGSTSDITKVAEEVVHLFTAGSQGDQKTVLLLVNGVQVLEDLQVSIMRTIANQKIVTRMPVVVLLSCIREDADLKSDDVFLQEVLSDSEKNHFNDKKVELNRKYGDKCKRFHGFNIMQSNFSEAYIQAACSVFKTIKETGIQEKTQLAAFLSLLNAYVPDSYLLEAQCLDVFKHANYSHRDISLEDMLDDFSHLIITIQQDGSEKRVRMAHPLIAQCCTELMAEAGVTRSDTAKNLLTCLCRDKVPRYLAAFVKYMLTKRRPKQKENGREENPIHPTEMQEEIDSFARLILHIQTKEDNSQCVSLLGMATNMFVRNPFFPQALARFHCIVLRDYDQAEVWAKEAKQRYPQNSFVADTLGQVHKNRLKNLRRPAQPGHILDLALKAIRAFEDEERLAEDEVGTNVKINGYFHVSRFFNTRGMFGFLQVCNLVYDLLVSQNQTWRGVLTKKVSLGSALPSLGDHSLLRFNDPINRLRDAVEKKFAFFEGFLTYSKPDMKQDDPEYISRETSACYRKYVGDSTSSHLKEKGADLIQKLKLKQAGTTTGVLSCLDRECTESDLKEITTLWEEICLHKDPVTAMVNNIFAHIMLRNTGATKSDCKHLTAFKQEMYPILTDKPEPHMLALLLHWPTDNEDTCILDLSAMIKRTQDLYKQAYANHFRTRYLRPMFFLGKGQELNRIVHRKALEGSVLQAMQDWSDEKIFQDPSVKEHLLKVRGEIREYRLFATVDGKDIEVVANLRNSLWRKRKVSFYLGFTIKGPVAFAIQTETADKKELLSEMDSSKPWPCGLFKFGACGDEMDARDLTELKPEVNRVDEVQTYSLQSDAGNYECSVSGLRWVCKEKVSFKYKFLSWEEHMRSPVCKDYMPAGPLMDITVTSGEIEEVHLPHSVCIDQTSTFSGQFAVLHVYPCCDVVEEVPKVTLSHITFLQPTFPPRGVMIRKMAGIPFYYDVLIYKTNKEFLALDVYVVPRDSALRQEVEEKQKSSGSILILNPSPDKSMQMGEHLSLTTDQADAIIQPSSRKLRYESIFFEVLIRNTDSDITLRLQSGKKKKRLSGPVPFIKETTKIKALSINKHFRGSPSGSSDKHNER
ncbi:sterile alpha motif domain-containing protein 9-like isoform X2 [Trematomus bernacchii]|uniref:sterile alpha motif domain-containing protein 9-like isoform X2 n=1 Tax=Trematomus bernacchii TaxID=40690 RepID=UPI00146AD958|nr:sterile alpha motif domain-containing protein 9-like isoform X2 [Trematomus bernacchii]